MKNSTQPPRQEQEHLDVCITDLLFLVTVSTAERVTRSVDNNLDDFMMADNIQNAEAAMLHGADIKEIAAEPMKVTVHTIVIIESSIQFYHSFRSLERLELRSMLWVPQLSWRSSNQDLRQGLFIISKRLFPKNNRCVFKRSHILGT